MHTQETCPSRSIDGGLLRAGRSFFRSVLFAFSLVGCGSSGDPGQGVPAAASGDGGVAAPDAPTDAPTDAPAPRVAEDLRDACRAWGTAYCAKIRECDPYSLEVEFKDEVGCVEELVASCASVSGAPDVRWKGDARRRCAGAVTSSSCEQYWLGYQPPECNPLPGDRPGASLCTFSAQCKSSNCVGSPDSICGLCLDKPRGKDAGAACALSSECDGALVCRAGRCADMGGEGETCTSDVHCRGFLVCANGRCARPLREGEPCVRDEACGESAACNRVSVCQKDRVVGPGEPCGRAPDGGFVACRGGSSCNEQTRVCQVEPKIGEPCREGGIACQGLARCIAGKCADPEPAGCPADGGGVVSMGPQSGVWRGQTQERRLVTFVVAGPEVAALEMQIGLSLGGLGCLVTLTQVGSAPILAGRAAVPVSGPIVGRLTLSIEFPSSSTATGRMGSVRGGFLTCGGSLVLGTESTLGGPWTVTAMRLRGDGDTCAQPTECGSGNCVSGQCCKTGECCGNKDQPCCGSVASGTCTDASTRCVSSRCAPCGALGGPCCVSAAGVTSCGAGALCASGVCARCGGPGETCCPSSKCDGSACCHSGRCVAEEQSCASVGSTASAGTCRAGKCECGKQGDPCCAVTAPQRCADANSLCQISPLGDRCVKCGGVDEPCCAVTAAQRCAEPDTSCRAVAGASRCVKCGVPGGPCCSGNQCASGCCLRLTSTESVCAAAGTACGINPGLCGADGACGTCGGLGQACCAPGPFCSAPGSSCVFDSGLGRSVCQPCGKLGQKCCGVGSSGTCTDRLRCAYDATARDYLCAM